jgi:hypothetical protein
MIHFYTIECRLRPEFVKPGTTNDWELEFDNHKLFSFTNMADAEAKAKSLEGTRLMREHKAVEYVRKK